MFIMFILMCLPLIALPVFWLLPPGQAVPIYVVSLLLSGSMFWLMRSNRKRPVQTGKESLVGRDAEVVAISRNGKRATYTLKIEGELWAARSQDTVRPGEKVVITASEGNMLIVRRKSDTAKSQRA